MPRHNQHGHDQLCRSRVDNVTALVPQTERDLVEALRLIEKQGWFRAKGDASGRDWVHYRRDQKFAQPTIDLRTDVSEHDITYPTPFKLTTGSTARVFSSHDHCTMDVQVEHKTIKAA